MAPLEWSLPFLFPSLYLSRRVLIPVAQPSRYLALFAWSLVLWITWTPLILNRRHEPSDRTNNALTLIQKLLFALFLCSAVLLFEKFSIQWIAGKFHERSYAGTW